MASANEGLPISGLWTWDHSTNWCDDPTRVESGCFNKYRKEPDSFIDDYRALLEFAGERGIPYLMIAGLFRDSHGGEQGAHELLAIARASGVKVLAGIGVAAYGGFYWEGDHPWSLETWLQAHPELAAVIADPPIKPHPGMHGLGMACPMKEETVRWYEQGTTWLLENFDVAGIYLETGDYGICKCETCRARSAERQESSPERMREMAGAEVLAGRVSHDDIALALPPVVDAAYATRPDATVVYSPYTGFTEAMAADPPAFVEAISPKAICQWTLTNMPYPEPWSADGALRPPTARSIGYTHWATQWGEVNTRHQPAVRYIREMCSRARTTGLEGVFIHGEMSARESLTARMNYEALAYFRLHPHATLEEFAENALADEFGGADEAVEAVTWLTQPADATSLLARRDRCRRRASSMTGPASESWRALESLFLSQMM